MMPGGDSTDGCGNLNYIRRKAGMSWGMESEGWSSQTDIVGKDEWEQVVKEENRAGAVSKPRNWKARDFDMAVEVTRYHDR